MLRRVSAADTWSGASYERIAETFAPIHDRIVEALAVEPGTRFLDVACGTGGVALRAARAGADVTRDRHLRGPARQGPPCRGGRGSRDPLRRGRLPGASVRGREFDVVASAFGAIFAPDTSAPPPSWRACAARAAGWRSRRGRPTNGRRRTRGRVGRSSKTCDGREWAKRGARPRAARRRVRARAADRRMARRGGLGRGALGARLDVDAAAPGLAREQSAEARAHAEKVYLEALASGVLARNYVLVLGTRR